MSDEIKFKEDDLVHFEKMYQYFVQQYRKAGLPDPTREEVLKILEVMEKDGVIERIDKTDEKNEI